MNSDPKYTRIDGFNFIVEMGNVLGFDPNNVQSVIITADREGLVRIEIEQIGDQRLLVALRTQFKVVEIKPDDNAI